MNQHTLEGGGPLYSETAESPRAKSVFSRFIASILAAVLSVAGLVALGPAAYAEAPGITQTVTHNGQELTDGAVLASGDTIRIALQYTPEVGDGTQVVIGLPEGVTVPEDQLKVPGGSNAIESVSQNAAGDIVLTFMDPYPPSVSQGIFNLDMILDDVQNSTSTEFSWMINGTPYTRDVIVTEPGAEEEDITDHVGKSVEAGNINQYVSISQGRVSIDEDILNEVFEYTLKINTDRDTDRSDVTIADDLSPYLTYNRDSFDATITTWDDIGWNSTTEAFDFAPEITENGFEYSGGVPNPSELTVKYSASVDEAQLETLTAQLQDAYANLNGVGSFSIDLDNTVTVGGGGSDNATVTLSGERSEDDEPTVIDDAVNKSVTGTDLDQYINFDSSNGTVTIDESITDHVIEYTLNVDTAAGTDRSNYTITDTLSEYLAYNRNSFEATITTWDEGGWGSETHDFAFVPDFEDNGFTFTGDIPASSQLTIKYSASVTADQLTALRSALQDQFDGLGVEPGDYRVELKNTANFGDDGQREANISVGNHRGHGQGPENVFNHLDKSTGNSVLNGYVTVYENEVSVDESILDAVINYTLTINTDGETDRSDYTISDELSEFLVYDQESFEANITTWNAEGWDRKTEEFTFNPEFSGNGFTFTGDIQNPSELTITYAAKVDPEQLDELTAALQEEFDALEAAHGNFQIQLENTATFGADETRTGNVPVRGHLDPPPVPNIEDAFDKGADFSSVNIGPAEDGTLEPPQPVTYTFSADLTQWTGQAADGYLNHEDFTLDRNVVIADSLPEQASWDTSADDFITGMDLTEATGFDGDAAAFAADEYQGQYAVVGQNLYINIGQSSQTNVQVSAKALINSVAGLTHRNEGGIDRYELTNNAQFTYSDDDQPYGSSVRVTLEDWGDGLQNEAKFSKNALGDDGPVRVDAGESATVEYRFQANGDWSNAVDVTKSYIVDERDPNIFDFSDLDQTVESISGTLHGNAVQFDRSHFDLSVNDDGNLIIALNDDGVALVDDSWAEPTAPYVVDIALNTIPLMEKQSLQIENSATLYGSDDHALYWSTTTSQASSFGDEAEVRKTIRDTANERWTQNLRVEVDEDGNLIQDHYVYNLEFIPHGNYQGVSIIPETDVLPEGLEFVGFVTHDNVDTGDNPVEGPVDLGGNVEAVYDEDTRTITIQSTGLLQQQPNISANVLVRVAEFELNVPVANFLGNSSAVFTPSDGFPLSIAKVNSEDNEVVIDDQNSRFRVLDSDENVVLEDAFVEDGFLRILDEDGQSRGLVVEEPGTYFVEEVVAPQGYELSTDRITVVVDENGNSDQQTFLNDPEDPEPAVSIIKGDAGPDPDPENPLIINDANTENDAVAYENGETRDIVINVHNTGNEDLVDVVLTDETQSGADIQELVWTLPNGETIAATADENGVLTAAWDGPWAVGDTITGTATLTIAADEELHTNLASVDAVGAASGIPVEAEDPYNAQPEPTYAVGDYVWIDANRDGLQGDDEEPLEGVTVVLYDGNTNELDRTTTDSNGRYIFDYLPAGQYEVRFILTDEQAEQYEFTTLREGTSSHEDSNAGFKGFSGKFNLGPSNSNVTLDYEDQEFGAPLGIDPTWDAGVVLIPVPEIGVDKNEPGDDEHQVEAGTHKFDVTITNTGNEALENFTWQDTTESGQDAQFNQEDIDGLEDLVLQPGDSYTIRASVEVAAGERHRDNFVVNADGEISGENVQDEDPTTFEGDPTYAIGDYVWIDRNNDGIQGEDERPLEGVTVVLYAGTGEEELDRTTTDDRGRYYFDNLPAGEYSVQFILTEEQAATYKFTEGLVGDVAADSDAGDKGRSGAITLGLENDFLTADEYYEYFSVEASEGIDPTWDAGVVLLNPAPLVDIIKGDGDAEERTITNDANTEDDAVAYEDGETRDIVFTVENTGNEDLVEVVLTDVTQSGADIENLVWKLPNGDELIAEDIDGVLTAEWDGPWAVGETITGVATLTLTAGEQLHTNLASVEAVGAGSGIPVEDDDPYNATPPEVVEDTPPPADGEEPTPDPSDDPSDPETPKNKDGELSSTGANFALMFGALGLLLLVTGGLLYARHRKGNEA